MKKFETMKLTDLYNRQLHPEERTPAKDIAEKSDGLYTQAQVEDQMRLMGMCVNGGCVSPGVAEELNGRTPTDPGARWINTGLTNADGNPLVIQALLDAVMKYEPSLKAQRFIEKAREIIQGAGFDLTYRIG